MATTTLPPDTENVAGPQVVKPGGKDKNIGGRPRKWAKVPISKKTSEVSEETFWEWLDKLPKDGWANRYICYVWRTAPIIDLSGGGKAITIEKIARPFDSQDILRTHGSGGYKFDVCERNADGTEQKRIRQSYETIIDMRYPPRVSLGDWVDHPQNKNWSWAIPELQAAETERSKRANPVAPEPVSAAAQIKESLELANIVNGGNKDESINAAIVKLISEISDPNRQFMMLKILKEMQPVDSGASKNDLMVEILREELRAMREELREARNSKPASDDLAATLLKTVLGRVMEGGDIFGGGGSPAKADLGSTIAAGISDVLGKVVEKGTEVLPGVLATIQHVKDRDLQIAQVAQSRQMNPERPWEFQGRTQPAVQPAVQPQPQPATPQPSQPTTPMPPAIPQPIQAFLAKYQIPLTKHMASIMHTFQNTDGYDMLETLLEREGRDFLDQFQKDASVDLLWQLTQLNANLKAVFQPEGKARQYFTELLTNPDEIPEGDDDDEEGEGKDTPVGRMGNA